MLPLHRYLDLPQPRGSAERLRAKLARTGQHDAQNLKALCLEATAITN
ncbi:hypothetical protein ACW0JT_18855 [Arthrobacter sp. SA17]